jgi:hypothetical protein
MIEGFENIDDVNTMLFEAALDLTDTIFNDPGHPAPGKWSGSPIALSAQADSYFVTYHSGSEYWYRYASFEDTTYDTAQQIDDILSLVLEDSVQFVHGSSVVQWPDSQFLTAINAGGALDMSAGSGSIHFGQFFSIVGDLPGMGDIVINAEGDLNVNLTDEESSCDFSFIFANDVSDVALNLTVVQTSDGCPDAGMIRHFGSAGIECTGDTTFSFNDTWIITQTFDNGTHTVKFENSTTTWSVTEDCGGQPPTVSGIIREEFGL